MTGASEISKLLLQCNDIDEYEGVLQPYVEEFLEISPRSIRDSVIVYLRALMKLSADQALEFRKELEEEDIDQLTKDNSLILLFYKTSHHIPEKSRMFVCKMFVSYITAAKLMASVTGFLGMDLMNYRRRVVDQALRSVSWQLGYGDSGLPPVDRGYEPEEYLHKIDLLKLAGSTLAKGAYEPKLVPFMIDFILAGLCEREIVDEFSSCMKSLDESEKVEHLAELWNRLMPEICRRRLRMIHLDSGADSVAGKNAKRALTLLGETIMTHTDGDKIEVTLGSGNTFYGDMVVAKSIQGSFNKASSASTSDELKQLLTELSIAVAAMSENLTDEEARRVARALDTVIEEATSEKPSRQWWEVSIEGLKKAAENIGSIGQPVLGLVGKLVPILTDASS